MAYHARKQTLLSQEKLSTSYTKYLSQFFSYLKHDLKCNKIQGTQPWKKKNVPDSWEISNLCPQIQNVSTDNNRYYVVSGEAPLWLQLTQIHYSQHTELFHDMTGNPDFAFILLLKHKIEFINLCQCRYLQIAEDVGENFYCKTK